MTLETKKANIKAAFLAINSQCDGARAQDNVGFNGFHARSAKEDIYSIDSWSDSKCRYWANAMRIYTKQLAGLGFDYANIVWDNSLDSSARSMRLENGIIKIGFNAKNKAEFNLLKEAAKEINGRRWNGETATWDIIPNATNKVQVLAFAEKHDFELPENLQNLLETLENNQIESTPEIQSNKLIKVSDNLWQLTFAFDWSIVNAIKALPSYKKWQPGIAGKPWHIATCHELFILCEKFNIAGREALLEVLNSQGVTINIEAAKPTQKLQLDDKQQANFELIAEKLLPYQKEPVKTLAIALLHGGALDASDTGTGKTYMALAAAMIYGQPIFVVCPLAVKRTWQNVAEFFGVKIEVVNYEMIRRGKLNACKLEKRIIESRASKKTIREFAWHLSKDTIIIFDECHRLKDGTTLQAQLGIAAIQQNYIVLGLSATAADNPLQMCFAALLTGLINDKKDFYRWAQANGVSKSKWGFFQFNGSPSILSDLHRQIFPKRGNRVKISELGDAFPETQILAECYDMGENECTINAVYNEMETQLAQLFERQKSDKSGCRGEHLVIMLRAKQQAELLKVPALVERAKDAMESGLAVAIFVNFEETLQALAEKLETDCIIKGGQSEITRQGNIAKFQADESDIIIANIRAGGVGVSLHGHANAKTRMAIICPTDSGQDLKQTFGRVHRAQGAKSLQRVFFAANTIEEKVCRNVQAKLNRIELLNDGDLALDNRIFEQ